jgi:integrase
MARPAENTLPLPDGRTVAASLLQRGDVYSVKFPNPTKPKQYLRVTTGCRTEFEAWAEAARIVLRTYTDAGLKPTAKTITWPQVLEELGKHGGKGKTKLRPRTLAMYRDAVTALRKTITTKGPFDVTPEVARRFATLYASTPYTRAKPRTIKRGADKGKVIEPTQYTRSAKTIDNAIHFLSCLWSAIIEMKYATTNPFDKVPRPTLDPKPPTAPTEDDFANLFTWVDGLKWELMSVFVRVKSLAGCRTSDLCQLRSYQFDAKSRTLTILATQDKTNKSRTIPLPESLAKRLDAIRGKTYLWEAYTSSIREHTNDPRAATEFTPQRLAMAVRRLFVKYAKAFPERPIMPHDLRRRAITQTVKACGSVDMAGDMLGVTAATARKHYLDSKQAFDTSQLYKKMSGILVPD